MSFKSTAYQLRHFINISGGNRRRHAKYHTKIFNCHRRTNKYQIKADLPVRIQTFLSTFSYSSKFRWIENAYQIIKTFSAHSCD